MGFGLRVGVLLFLLVAGTLSQDGFDLSDAIDDDLTTTAKPKEVPKASEKPKTDGGDDFGLDLGDAVGPDPTTPAKPKEVPKVPEKPKTDGGDGFDLGDALGPGPDPKPDKPAVNPGGGGGGGGGGGFDDLDLVDGKLDPDSGHGGGPDPGYNQDGADQPQDPDLLWGQILKMLNANMPEEFYMWMSNLKQMLTPLLERAMDLLRAMP
ncbi:CD99 molecule isoform X2 [Sebastes fasciatus]|uniref:CD99 molecule isoform X2 n=1 Tax=Sebastes fasciatus TaxID=394691 RepID=UPI003D9E421A